MSSFPPELRRYRLVVLAASLGLASAGTAAGVIAASPTTTREAAWVLAVFAITALVVAGFGIVCVPRWYRRAGYVVTAIPPVQSVATLLLESDSDSTSLYATVARPEDTIECMDRVALLIPQWDIHPLLGLCLPVALHVDPSTSRLMAITTQGGVLWCMPRGQRVRNRTAA